MEAKTFPQCRIALARFMEMVLRTMRSIALRPLAVDVRASRVAVTGSDKQIQVVGPNQMRVGRILPTRNLALARGLHHVQSPLSWVEDQPQSGVLPRP